MTPYYDVRYTHVVEREVTCVVEAENEEDAIEKARDGETVMDDEQECPEQGIETKDYECLGVSEYRDPLEEGRDENEEETEEAKDDERFQDV